MNRTAISENDLMKWSGLLRQLNNARGIWAVSDQGIVSLGNFLTTILLARCLPSKEYGIYALIFGTMILLNNLHAAAIVYPLLAKGAANKASELRQMASESLLMTGVLGLLWSFVIIWITAAVGHFHLAFGAACALTLWQLQETLRRALMSQLRHREALYGDALSYFGQVSLVWLLGREGYLTLSSTFAVIAATSIAAGLLQARQVGIIRITFQQTWERVKDFSRSGQWTVLGVFCTSFTSLCLPWVLGIFHGTSTVASYQSVANLLGATHPIMLSVGSLVIPAVAHGYAHFGIGAAWQAALRHSMQGAVLLIPYLVFLTIIPGLVLRMLYGTASPYANLEAEVRIMALIYFIMYLTIITEYFLSGLEEARLVFRTQFATACLHFLLCIPFAIWGGLRWGLIGAIFTAMVRLLLNFSQILPYLKREESKREASIASELPFVVGPSPSQTGEPT